MQSVTPFQQRSGLQRQNYEALTMYLPASVRIWNPINPIARGLECGVPRRCTVASDLAVLSPIRDGD